MNNGLIESRIESKRRNLEKRFIIVLTLLVSSLSFFAGNSNAGVTSCQNLPARIAGATPVYYGTLLDAYNAAVNGDVIQTLAVTFNQNLTLSRNVSVTFDGGYDCSYQAYIGSTSLVGSVVNSFSSLAVGKYGIRASSPDQAYAIASYSSAGGTISPAGTMSLSLGNSQTYTVTPSTGYRIGQVLVDGVSVGRVSSYTISNINASHTVYASFNIIAPPTGSILINGGAGYTNNPTVTLNLSATDPDGLSMMKFSINGIDWDSAEPYALSKTWTLSSGDGEKKVYVMYMDQSEEWSIPYEATIILDTVNPAGSIEINNGALSTNSSQVTLTLNANDERSGVDFMQFSNDGTNWSVEEAYSPSKVWSLVSGDGTKYVYVKFKDNAGNSFTTSSFIALAYAPSNLNATKASDTEINLAWNDNSGNETGFRIEYKTGAGAYTILADVGPDVTSYVADNLTKNTTYYFRLRAIDSTGFSAYSQEASATTYALATPLNFTAQPKSVTRIDLSWTYNGTGQSNFYIMRRGEWESEFSLISISNANDRTYIDGVIYQNTTYYYYIFAYSPTNGWSANSPVIMATSPTQAVPGDVSATAISSTQIKLTWTYSTQVSQFVIQRKAGVTGAWEPDGGIGMSSNGRYYNDYDIYPNTTYYYRIRGCSYNASNQYNNCSDFSSEVTPPLAKFTNVSVSGNPLNTAIGGTSTISFVIDVPATVTLKIIRQADGSSGSALYQTSQVCATAGTYTFTWDGKDGAGNIVDDEAYLFVFEAVDSNGFNKSTYSPSAPGGTVNVMCSQGSSYNPYRNEPLQINYDVPQPVRLTVEVRNSAQRAVPLNNMPVYTGSYVYEWNGRDDLDGLMPYNAAASCSGTPLGENVIITTGATPNITSLKMDPYEINLSYGEFTRIHYTLSREADVKVELVPPSGAVYTIVNERQSGEQIVKWPNYETGNTIQFPVLQEGIYTISVEATAAGKRYVTKGTLKVGY